MEEKEFPTKKVVEILKFIQYLIQKFDFFYVHI